MRVEILHSGRTLATRGADRISEVLQPNPHAVLALPSGRTPLGLYDELARRVADRTIDFSTVTAFAVDEMYGAPRSHPATNATYFSTRVTYRFKLRVLHIMDSGAPAPHLECQRFSRLIEDAGGIDLAVLGIGVNGHVAFNEPGSPFDSRARRVELERSTREPYVEAFGSFDRTPEFGLTLGLADLMEARRILLLASGRSKARAVAAALERPRMEDVPASVLQRHHDVSVFLDEEAAALLKGHYQAP